MIARKRLEYLIDRKKKVDITEKRAIRTLSQNRYLHLLLGAYGMDRGYTLEESKIIYKTLNKGVYEYQKNGRTFLRSSADLDTQEMTKTIDYLRQISDEEGFPLPLPNEKEWLEQIEIEMSRNSFL